MAEVDLNEIFASMAKFITIMCSFAIRAAMNWEIHQLDVMIAFFNGVLEVEIYIDQPEGFVQEGKMNTLCVNTRKLYMCSSNCQGHGTTISICFSSMRNFVGANWIVRCMLNKWVGICWWKFFMWII